MHPGLTPDGPATVSFPSTRWSLIVASVDKEKDRFRSFLRVVCSNFLVDVRSPALRRRTHPTTPSAATRSSPGSAKVAWARSCAGGTASLAVRSP